MKKVIAVTVMAMMAVVSQADFFTVFDASFGFSANYASDASGLIPLLANGEQASVQVIYAGANGVPDYLSVVGQDFQLASGGLAAGDDIILSEFLTPVANTLAGDFSEYGLFNKQVTAPYVGNGMVFVRVFDAAKSVYFQQAVVTLNNLDTSAVPPPTADIYAADNVTGPAFAGLQANGDNFVVIPEPATFGLMGVAGLGLFLARKKARS